MSPLMRMLVALDFLHAAQNLGLLRRLCINLLKQEPDKMSLKMKRYKAGMDNDFLLKILAGAC